VLNVPLPGAGAIAARRPIPQLSQIADIRWNGWATYHAFTLAAKRRFTKGLMFDANSYKPGFPLPWQAMSRSRLLLTFRRQWKRMRYRSCFAILIIGEDCVRSNTWGKYAEPSDWVCRCIPTVIWEFH